MKKCPFCAEEIKDEALRCKHCGGDIAARSAEIAAAEKKSADKRRNSVAGLLVGAVGGFAIAQSSGTPIPTTIVATVLSAVFFPVAWALGSRFGVLCQPNIVIDSSVVRLGLRRLSYAGMPFWFGAVAGMASLYIAAVIAGENLDSKPSATAQPTGAQPAVRRGKAVARANDPTIVSAPDIPVTPSAKDRDSITVSAASEPGIAPKSDIRQSSNITPKDSYRSKGSVAAPRSMDAQSSMTVTDGPAFPIADDDVAALPKPSFNCESASLNVEKMICADPALANADSSLAEYYRRNMAYSGGDPATLRHGQKAFLDRRNNCATVECIAEAYRSRNKELEKLGYLRPWGTPAP